MLSCTSIQIIGGDADVDHSQPIGEDAAKILGGIYPSHPPWVSAPLKVANGKVSVVSFTSW